MGILPWEIRVAFLRESHLRQSRATQPTVHAGCFSVSIIHRALTWTRGSFNVRTDVNAFNCTPGCADTERESALNVVSGRKIPCRTLSHRGIKPVSATHRSDAQLPELHLSDYKFTLYSS